MNADSLESWLFVFLIRGGVVAAAWLFAGVLLRKLSASRASVWWRGGFVALFAVLAVPPNIALFRIPTLENGPVYPTASGIREYRQVTDPLPFELTNSVVTPSRNALPGNWWFWLWFGGTVILSGRLFVSWIRVSRLIRSALPLLDAEILEIVEEECRSLGLRGNVTLKTHTNISTPFATGLLRYTIVLPENARVRGNDPRLIIRHELAHFARCDIAWQLLAEMAVVLHWVNPLAWLLKRRLRLDHESAADDLVLAGGTDEVRYAAILFEAAREKCRLSREVLVVPMARPSTLRRRVGLILDATRDRNIAGPAAKLSAVAVACISAVAIGFTSVRAESEEKAKQTWSRRYHDTLRLEKSFGSRFGGTNSEALAAFRKELETHGVPLNDSIKFELSPGKETLIVDFEDTDRGAIEGKMLQLMSQVGWWRDDESIRKQTIETVLTPLRNKVQQTANELAEIRRTANVIDPDPENANAVTASADNNVAQVEARLREKQLRVTEVGEQFDRIKRLQGEEVVVALRTAKIEDHTMEKMENALHDALIEETRLKAEGLGEKHPRRRAVRSQIEVFEKTMDDALTSVKQNQLALLEIERRTLKNLEAEFEEAKKKQMQSKAEILEYLKVKAQYLKNKRAYETAQMKYEIEDLERGDRQSPDATK